MLHIFVIYFRMGKFEGKQIKGAIIGMWDNDTLIKKADYNVRWYRREQINIIASDG